jgi:uncharacterized protein with PIN domain
MDITEANAEQTGYLFVPFFQQMRRHLRRDFINGEPSTWIPVECSLLVCYEFAACSLQTRYIFVAILLLCGMRGSDKIPANTRFLANALSADERTIRKSIAELLEANLLAERKKERKTEKTHTAQKERENESDAVRVDSENLSQNGNGHRSQFSLDDCFAYVKMCESKGEPIKNAKGLANHLFKTGEADAFILATLYPQKHEEAEKEIFGEPRQFSDEPCAVCFGSKMEVVAGKGARPCPNCKNEKGHATGKQPKGENDEENN